MNDDELLDHFAGLAMQALIQSHKGDPYLDRQQIALSAFAQADHMLKVRNMPVASPDEEVNGPSERAKA